MKAPLLTLVGLALAWAGWQVSGWLVEPLAPDGFELPLRAALMAGGFALAQGAEARLAAQPPH